MTVRASRNWTLCFPLKERIESLIYLLAKTRRQAEGKVIVRTQRVENQKSKIRILPDLPRDQSSKSYPITVTSFSFWFVLSNRSFKLKMHEIAGKIRQSSKGCIVHKRTLPKPADVFCNPSVRKPCCTITNVQY